MHRALTGLTGYCRIYRSLSYIARAPTTHPTWSIHSEVMLILSNPVDPVLYCAHLKVIPAVISVFIALEGKKTEYRLLNQQNPGLDFVMPNHHLWPNELTFH